MTEKDIGVEEYWAVFKYSFGCIAFIFFFLSLLVSSVAMLAPSYWLTLWTAASIEDQ